MRLSVVGQLRAGEEVAEVEVGSAGALQLMPEGPPVVGFPFVNPPIHQVSGTEFE